MPDFCDTDGRKWEIRLTVGAAKRLRDLAGVNIADPGALTALADDPVRLGDALWAIVQPQAEQKGLDAAAFFEALDADCLDALTEALLEALANFTPPARRPAIRKLLGKSRELHQKTADAASAMIDEGVLERLHAKDIEHLRAEIEKMLKEKETSGPTSTDSPESAA